MPATKVLARGWSFSINTGSSGAPTWVLIKGVTSFTVNKNMKEVSTTDFDNAGWESHLVASRGWEFTLEGFFLEDASAVRDPGQQAVDNNALLIGASSLDDYKFTSPNGKLYTFSASTETVGPSGGNDDVTKWGCKLKVSGQVTIA